VYISSTYGLILGRVGFVLPLAMVPPGSFCFVSFSGHGVGFSTKLGGDTKMIFCFLHGESKDGAGLDNVLGAQYMWSVIFALLVIGVEMLLSPPTS
jgi:hypothetical protein